MFIHLYKKKYFTFDYSEFYKLWKVLYYVVEKIHIITVHTLFTHCIRTQWYSRHLSLISIKFYLTVFEVRLVLLFAVRNN